MHVLADLTSVSWRAKLPRVAALAVDVSILAVAEDHRVERLLAGGAVGALLVEHALLALLPAGQDPLGVEHLAAAPGKERRESVLHSAV